MIDRIAFRNTIDHLIFRYEKEDQDAIMKEIEEVLKISREEVLSKESIVMVIYMYFKNKGEKK